MHEVRSWGAYTDSSEEDIEINDSRKIDIQFLLKKYISLANGTLDVIKKS
jgi:hypothetical protein